MSSGVQHLRRIAQRSTMLNYEGSMAMVMVAAILLMVLMMKMMKMTPTIMMLSTMSKMIRLSTRVAVWSSTTS